MKEGSLRSDCSLVPSTPSRGKHIQAIPPLPQQFAFLQGSHCRIRTGHNFLPYSPQATSLSVAATRSQVRMMAGAKLSGLVATPVRV